MSDHLFRARREDRPDIRPKTYLNIPDQADVSSYGAQLAHLEEKYHAYPKYPPQRPGRTP
jgi:hypothetical protein